jgi:hypothetical protein
MFPFFVCFVVCRFHLLAVSYTEVQYWSLYHLLLLWCPNQMKLFKIEAKLIGITSDLENYFFEVQCGNGPVVLSASNDGEFSVPHVSSSSSIAHLSVNIIGKVGTVKKLFGSKVAKVKCSAGRETIDLVYSKATGDQIDVMVKITYKLVMASVYDAVRELGNGQGICVSVSFIDTAKEDMSIRVLNEQGTCISMTTIDALTVSSFIVLHHEHKTMELSIAGKNSGVITVPIESDVPFVTKIESFPSGYVLLSVQVVHGHPGRVMCLDDVLIDPPKGEQYVYHIENIRMDVEETARFDQAKPCSGVVHGPIVSRVELPSYSQGSGRRIMYALPATPPLPVDDSLEEAEAVRVQPKALFDSGMRGLILSEDDPAAPIRTRLSVIRVLDGHRDSDEQVNEGPCGVVLVSAILKEIDRQCIETVVHADADANEPCSPTQAMLEQSGYPWRVAIGGDIDYVADLPELPYMVGDRLTASVIVSAIEPPPAAVEASEVTDEDKLEAESRLHAMLMSSPRAPVQITESLPLLKQAAEEVDKSVDTQSTGAHGAVSPQLSLSMGAGGSIIQLLSDELKEKQRVIDRLLDDNSLKAEVSSNVT